MDERFKTIAVNEVIKYYNDTSGNKHDIINRSDISVISAEIIKQYVRIVLSVKASESIQFEFTWNEFKKEGCLEVYKKVDSVTIK